MKMKKVLAIVEQFKKSGILFVPLPVTDDDDYIELFIDVYQRLDILIAKSEQCHDQ